MRYTSFNECTPGKNDYPDGNTIIILHSEIENRDFVNSFCRAAAADKQDEMRLNKAKYLIRSKV